MNDNVHNINTLIHKASKKRDCKSFKKKIYVLITDMI